MRGSNNERDVAERRAHRPNSSKFSLKIARERLLASFSKELTLERDDGEKKKSFIAKQARGTFWKKYNFHNVALFVAEKKFASFSAIFGRYPQNFFLSFSAVGEKKIDKIFVQFTSTLLSVRRDSTENTCNVYWE